MKTFLTRTHISIIILILSLLGCGEEIPQSAIEQILKSDPVQSADIDVSTTQVTAVPAHIQEPLLAPDGEPIYHKYIDAGGIALVSTNNVDDRILQACREMILSLTGKHPRIRQTLSPENDFRIIIYDSGVESWDDLNIRIASTPVPIGFCSGSACAIPIEFDPEHAGFFGISMKIFLHEFAHAIHGALVTDNTIVPEFGQRLIEAYNEGLQSPKYKAYPDDYEYTSASEYWAELSARYYKALSSYLKNVKPPPGYEHIHDADEVRAEYLTVMQETYPKLLALLQDVYPQKMVRWQDLMVKYNLGPKEKYFWE